MFSVSAGSSIMLKSVEVELSVESEEEAVDRSKKSTPDVSSGVSSGVSSVYVIIEEKATLSIDSGGGVGVGVGTGTGELGLEPACDLDCLVLRTVKSAPNSDHTSSVSMKSRLTMASISRNLDLVYMFVRKNHR